MMPPGRDRRAARAPRPRSRNAGCRALACDRDERARNRCRNPEPVPVGRTFNIGTGVGWTPLPRSRALPGPACQARHRVHEAIVDPFRRGPQPRCRTRPNRPLRGAHPRRASRTASRPRTSRPLTLVCCEPRRHGSTMGLCGCTWRGMWPVARGSITMTSCVRNGTKPSRR